MPLHSRLLLQCTIVISLLWSGAPSAQDTYTQNEAARRTPAEAVPEEATEEAAREPLARPAAEPPAAGADGAAASEPESGSTAAKAPAGIAQAVAREFRNDPLTALAGATVQKGGPGEILITGTVPTLMAKARATHIAEAVRGVVAVRNELRVAPGVQRSANDLESAITQALTANAATDAFDVRVQAGPGGEVLLTGEVGSWAERELVSRVARNVRGVVELRNALQINPPPMRTDLDLERAIEQLLRWDAYIEESDVEVAVKDAVAHLSGEARSAAEKRRIVAMAWSADPASVDAAQLRVASNSGDSDKRQSAQQGARAEPRATTQAGTTMSPADIAAAVRAIARALGVTGSDAVNVQFANGVVTLSGEVDSLQASRALESHAEGIVGVRQVRNQLSVPSTTPEIDQVTATRVRHALITNSVTDQREIDVSVANGVVKLTGEVDTWYERGAADDAAAGVRGVRAVENDLRVARMSERATADPYVDSWSIYDYDWYTPEPPRVQQQDSVIAAQIRDEMWWSPFIEADAVRVDVEDGVATLTGSVDSLSERRAAAENAWEGGALRVDNQLRVSD